MMKGSHLDLNDLKGDMLKRLAIMEGVNTAYVYIGEFMQHGDCVCTSAALVTCRSVWVCELAGTSCSVFGAHSEDADLPAINYLVKGDSKWV